MQPTLDRNPCPGWTRISDRLPVLLSSMPGFGFALVTLALLVADRIVVRAVLRRQRIATGFDAPVVARRGVRARPTRLGDHSLHAEAGLCFVAVENLIRADGTPLAVTRPLLLALTHDAHFPVCHDCLLWLSRLSGYPFMAVNPQMDEGSRQFLGATAAAVRLHPLIARPFDTISMATVAGERESFCATL